MSFKVCTICKKEKQTKEFNRKSSSKDGLQNVCRECNSERNKIHYELNSDKVKARTFKRKKIVVNNNVQYIWNYLKKHPCIDCQESNPIVLEFDHVRGTKRLALSQLVRRGNCLQTIVIEISKCEVRCANCHRKKTAKDFHWYKNINTD